LNGIIVQVGGNITLCLPYEFESLKTTDIFENLINLLEELKPHKIKRETSLSPFTLGFFKYWGNCIKIGGEVFEVQCEKDLNDNWKKYVDDSKIPDCLRYRDNCRELFNIDCTWVPKNSGPYWKSETEQILPKVNPTQSYIYLAIEHAEDNKITLEGSNMGSTLTGIRKLGYIKSLFKIVIYKPFKGEVIKNEPKIQEQLESIRQEIKRIGLRQEKERAETWLIIMLFTYFKSSSIKIDENELLLRGYELNRSGEVNKNIEKYYYEYRIKDFYPQK